MALEIPHTFADGSQCTYHRVAEILAAVGTTEAYAVVHSFSDAQTAHLAAPLHRRTYRFARTSSDAVDDAYARIKTLPEWAGAVDVP